MPSEEEVAEERERALALVVFERVALLGREVEDHGRPGLDMPEHDILGCNPTGSCRSSGAASTRDRARRRATGRFYI
jgi:hypothetical protein